MKISPAVGTALILSLAHLGSAVCASGDSDDSSSSSDADFTITTCQDLIDAVAATSDEDVTAEIDPDGNIDCDTGGDVVNLVIENNQLTVLPISSEEETFSQLSLFNVRFEVASGALLWEPDVVFEGNETDTQEVNGGWLNVAEGAEATFLGDVEVQTYVVRCETGEGTDFCQEQWDGGCAWNEGSFQVDGHATFLSCGNFGGGESSPGRGGAVFNGETGSITFGGGVTMEDTTLTDDEGNDGAGIYNAGTVEVEGPSRFKDLVADTNEAGGGAIYNAEGAEFAFGYDAVATFISDGANQGGAVFNEGIFKFFAPALFTDCSNSAIYNADAGELTLSTGTVFWGNSAEPLGYGSSADAAGGALFNEEGGTLLDENGDELDFDGFIFQANTIEDAEDPTLACENVYLQTQAGTDNAQEEFECAP